jgi:exodeoxyribonuclease VII large subunit
MNTPPPRTVYTVTELNGSVRLLLSSHFGAIWVEGEISNLALPSSGHLYFTLKDPDAQVRCALFRGPARGLGFKPANGMRVVARAQVSLYEPRGEYQLIVDYLEEAGDGALRRAFEALKAKLAGEGLFDASAKRPIPVPPTCVGVITSPTGAAVRDILTVLKRRFPALPVILFPVKVQGNEAKHDIARAIALAGRLHCCDALILARGGGSLEDLWAFNEEIVARAMAACAIPIISGVGHETDFTIADLVADLRAPTPSAAAEAVSPDGGEWLARFVRLEGRLQQQIRLKLKHEAQSLAHLHKRHQQAHPEKQMQRNAQRLDELELRLGRAVLSGFSMRDNKLQTMMAKLDSQHPAQRIQWLETRHAALGRRLEAGMARLLELSRQALKASGEKLHAVSPLATLERGYAIASRGLDGKILRKIGDVQTGESVGIRLTDGTLIGQVLEKRKS